VYGARPLRRLMQHEIDDRLATALLKGQIKDGDVVRVDVAPDGESLAVAVGENLPPLDLDAEAQAL
jgi:ATP-dependent Clp protease ATP-binding subunit ClpB